MFLRYCVGGAYLLSVAARAVTHLLHVCSCSGLSRPGHTAGMGAAARAQSRRPQRVWRVRRSSHLAKTPHWRFA